MGTLFLLVPLSVVLVLAILARLWWAIYSGQFEDVDAEGDRKLTSKNRGHLASFKKTSKAKLDSLLRCANVQK
ncbi:MAG: cbb3-type cytochrome oxidase assembly protein CcoS [Methylophilaceae bacterium]|nr:cbb3-type cytochrome oxidase assembly protein CcoS [Methylophilaceae bacterium]